MIDKRQCKRKCKKHFQLKSDSIDGVATYLFIYVCP